MKKNLNRTIAALVLILIALSGIGAMASTSTRNAPRSEETVVEEAPVVVEEKTEEKTEEVKETKAVEEKAEEVKETKAVEEKTEEVEEKTEEVEEEEIEATAKTVVVRAAADGMSEIIAKLAADADITIVETCGDWYKISAGEVSGYIYAGDITEQVSGTPKLTIFTSRTAHMSLNADIVLTSKLEGIADQTKVGYQWQCDKGNGFENVEGATSATYTYKATVETLSYAWRLAVTIAD